MLIRRQDVTTGAGPELYSTLCWLQGQGGVDAMSEYTSCSQTVVGCSCECEVHRRQAVRVGRRVNDGTDHRLKQQPPAAYNPLSSLNIGERVEPTARITVIDRRLGAQRRAYTAVCIR